MSAIREMKDKGEITLNWLNKEQQISNCLTKKETSYTTIMLSLQRGTLEEKIVNSFFRHLKIKKSKKIKIVADTNP